MRTLTLSLVAAMTVAGTTSAQADFEIYPGVTSFTSRGNISTGTGEVHQGFHSQVIRGLGDTAGICQLNGVRTLLQDQDRTTPGTYSIVIRSGTDATGPDPTPAGVIFQTPVITFPTATGTGAVAWNLTTNFATPVVLPCDSFFSLGIEFPAAPLWTADGESCHASNSGANAQHANSVDMAWQIIAGVASHPSQKRSFRIAALVTMALQAGNQDATAPLDHFGNGGFFPDTALTGTASQGLSFRCEHPSGAAATAYVFGSVTGFAAVPFPIAGVGNRGYIDLVGLIPFAVAVGPADGSTIPFLTAGLDALPSAAGGMMTFQALVADLSVPAIDFTNAIAVVLN